MCGIAGLIKPKGNIVSDSEFDRVEQIKEVSIGKSVESFHGAVASEEASMLSAFEEATRAGEVEEGAVLLNCNIHLSDAEFTHAKQHALRQAGTGAGAAAGQQQGTKLMLISAIN